MEEVPFRWHRVAVAAGALSLLAGLGILGSLAWIEHRRHLQDVADRPRPTIASEADQASIMAAILLEPVVEPTVGTKGRGLWRSRDLQIDARSIAFDQCVMKQAANCEDPPFADAFWELPFPLAWRRELAAANPESVALPDPNVSGVPLVNGPSNEIRDVIRFSWAALSSDRAAALIFLSIQGEMGGICYLYGLRRAHNGWSVVEREVTCVG